MAGKADQQTVAQNQPAAKAPDAGDWLEAAQQDIEVMDMCYDKEYYGASAYHCQQALEKTVKFMVVKYRLMENPAHLNHDLIRKLLRRWKKMGSTQNEWANDAISTSCDMLDEIVRGSRSCSREAGKTRAEGALSLKEWIWAYSLGIPVPRSAVERFRIRMEAPPPHLINKFLDRHFSKKAKNRIQKKLKKARDKKDNSAIITTAYEECVRILWIEFQRRYKPHAGRKHLPGEVAEACLLLWMMANLDTLLKIIPHEEYGRYPDVLDKKSYAQLYVEYSKGLLDLKELVRGSINELLKMIGRERRVQMAK